MSERLGTVVSGRWRLERELGRGGMATVYAATHRNGSRVAVKIALERDKDLCQRFIAEGYIGNRVEHPGAVRTLDDGMTDDGFPFLVMELLDGETLSERLDREGRLHPSEAVRIALDVLSVLRVAHAVDVVHRDVKPANVFLTRQGIVKLLDFGIARDVRPGIAGTVAGTILGTPSFMAPEQERGRVDQVDARTDLWATAAMLFVALTNRDLRTGGTPLETLGAAMDPVPPVRSLAPEVSPALAFVLDRALAFDPNARFSSAVDMQTALRACTLPTAPLSVSEPMTRSTPKIIGAVATGCALVAIAVALAFSVSDKPEATRSFLPPVPTALVSTTTSARVEVPTRVESEPVPVVKPKPVPRVVVAPPVRSAVPAPAKTADPMSGRF
jgi:serine/threonine-protein kinase